MKTFAASILLAFPLFGVPTTHIAHADTFGNGASEFDIEFVSIGESNNPDDTTGSPLLAGKVEYSYSIGKYEISEEMVDKANALGGLGITHDNRGADKPATSITWFEAATFVNWLNTSTGHMPAYKLSGGTLRLWQPGSTGYNPANPFRNSQAFYFLPSADEWYKAAYYDATAGVYYNYPNGKDVPPSAVGGSAAQNTAVYAQPLSLSPADITFAGGMSPYGTVGQGGNVWEWEEPAFSNGSNPREYVIRGGDWIGRSPLQLRSEFRTLADPSIAGFSTGFRVASVPEPGTVLLSAVLAGGLLVWRTREAAVNKFSCV